MSEIRKTFGIIIGSRNFFPDSLVQRGRAEILQRVEALGHEAIALDPEATPSGAVETRHDAEKCAALFRAHRDRIDGILVTLPNFGDERAVAEALRLSGLDVPVLVHAFPDALDRLDVEHRRDAFCGKISLCNNLVQYGIPFTNTAQHVESPQSDAFAADLRRFAGICSVVNGLRTARVGVVGVRPAAFNTVRFSEKILERAGISIETLDLAEAIARAEAYDRSAESVADEIERVRTYIPTDGIPAPALDRMARLSVALSEWIEAESLDAIAVQCWTAIEKLYGIVPCTAMSMLSERLIPSACEADIMGALSMYALVLATGRPAALADWNNNYGDDPDKVIAFHCSNFPKSHFAAAAMSYQEIIAGDVGRENTCGTCVGRIAPGPATFLRLSTDDLQGRIVGYVAQGEFLDHELKTFGGYGVAQIPDFEGLLNVIVRQGFEHHAAFARGHVAPIVREAMETYLRWPLHDHTHPPAQGSSLAIRH